MVCSQVLLEVQLLKSSLVNSQPSERTSAALLQGSDVSKSRAQASGQSPFQLPSCHRASLAHLRLQDEIGQHLTAQSCWLLELPDFLGENRFMLKIGTWKSFPLRNNIWLSGKRGPEHGYSSDP